MILYYTLYFLFFCLVWKNTVLHTITAFDKLLFAVTFTYGRINRRRAPPEHACRLDGQTGVTDFFLSAPTRFWGIRLLQTLVGPETSDTAYPLAQQSTTSRSPARGLSRLSHMIIIYLMKIYIMVCISSIRYIIK